MNFILAKIAPVVLIFILGYYLKRVKILSKPNADLLLKIVFHVSVPALILISIPSMILSFDSIYLPIISSLVIFITYFLARLIEPLLGLEKQTFGAFLVGVLILNIGFVLPFVLAAYGKEGLAKMMIFDAGNALLAFTFVYYLACKYGSNDTKMKSSAKKLLYSPPLISLVVALLMNFFNVKLPEVGFNLFQLLGDLMIPLIMISLGVYFSPKIVKLKAFSVAIFLRMFIGLGLGLLFAYLFNLEGLSKVIVLIGSSAPIGYNTLTFSSMEKLDKEFAASIISYSVLIGLFLIPLIMYLFS